MLNTGRSYLDITVFIVSFSGFICSNKYVLTKLEFKYPTVFQGWQTLFALIFIRLVVCLRPKHAPHVLDRTAFITLLPNLFFFIGSLVASSKALAEIPVLVFLTVQNAVPSLLFVLDNGPRFYGVRALRVIACIIQLLSVVAIILLDLQMTFRDSPYFWLLTHVLCSAVHLVHGRVADLRYSDMDRLYYSYLFGVVTLAPASLYLEEAFLVLQFAYKSRADFVIGCLFAGMFGVLLAIFSIHVQELGAGWAHLVARACVGVACVWLFDGGSVPSIAITCLIGLNFVCSALVGWLPERPVKAVHNGTTSRRTVEFSSVNLSPARKESVNPDKETLLPLDDTLTSSDFNV